MDRKDRNSLLMAAGGAAVMGVSMMASQSLSGMEVTNDVLEVVKTILSFIPAASSVISIIGLAQLAIKYGGKVYNLIRQKIQEKYHISAKEADKMLHSVSNDAKSFLKGNNKEMIGIMEKGFNRGAPINNPPSNRRSARNPVSRNTSEAMASGKQVAR